MTLRRAERWMRSQYRYAKRMADGINPQESIWKAWADRAESCRLAAEALREKIERELGGGE